jgi:hypothetical protein
MNKYFWFNILLVMVILLIIAYFIPIKLTGMAVNQIYLSIKSSIDGEVTAFVYDTFIDLEEAERQEIFVEFTNTGTENYTAQIEEYIYFYENNQLNETAYYYDSTVILYPGMKRAFRTMYYPLKEGFYYIKVKASYGTKRTETWGSFYAGFIFPNTTPGEPGPGGGGGGGIPSGGGGYTPPTEIHVGAQPLELKLNYSEELEVYPGQNVLTSINAKNIGNATLHDIKLYFSASYMINIDVNPKVVYYLDRNESVIFLLDIDTDDEIPYGTYPIDFEIVTREIKRDGTINLNVLPYNLTLEEEVKRTIENYEYLITELDIDILEAFLKDVDVSLAEESLDLAKINLEAAKSYYKLGYYEQAMEKLNEVRQNLKDTVFRLAQASFGLFVPGFSPIWILIIAILIGLLFLFLLTKRKKKKPKLLRAVEEGET